MAGASFPGTPGLASDWSLGGAAPEQCSLSRKDPASVARRPLPRALAARETSAQPDS